MADYKIASTPARLTADATRKLPRTVLLIVGVVYILAGLFLRDPWKTDDVVGIAAMLQAVNAIDLSAWLLPHLDKTEIIPQGPFTSAVGALFIIILKPFFALFTSETNAIIIASRIPNLLWFAITCASVWYGTYLLGRRPEPQPLKLPFGGEPDVRDYGRMLADAALLLTVATIGILWLTHETSVASALIAFNALSFYAMARLLDRSVSGSITLGVALGIVFLIRGWIGFIPIVCAVLICFNPRSLFWHKRNYLFLSLAIAFMIIAGWFVWAQNTAPYLNQLWIGWQKSLFTLPNTTNISRAMRDLPWFLWPTWPLAIIAIWQWRKWLNAPHILLPISLGFVPFIFIFLHSNSTELDYSLMAVPSAILAAFSIPTLRRGFVNSVDWFAVMCFSLTITTVWFGWFALQTGFPPKISHNITRLISGYEITIAWLPLIIALIGTIAWIALVRWRLIHKPLALWRGTVLSAGGLIITWLLLATLWMPVLDYARSYRQLSGQIANVLDTNNAKCVRNLGIASGQAASFYVFNNISFTYDIKCPFVLQQTSIEKVRSRTVFTPSNAQVLWQGKRRADRSEMFRLLRIQVP